MIEIDSGAGGGKQIMKKLIICYLSADVQELTYGVRTTMFLSVRTKKLVIYPRS